jgi:ribonuclease D
MPIIEYPDSTLVTTQPDLDDLIAHIRHVGRFAFDTEFVSEDTYEPVLCLVQVATEDRLVAFDPLAFRDIGRFWDVVNDPSIEVVMHAASEDLRICRFQTETIPAHVFDVQIAAGLVGFGYPLSLGNLVSQLLQVSVFGGETRTDWRRRPLSPAQLRYALDDVRYLLPMADSLKTRLREMGRESWAEAELREFLDTIQNRDEESRWRRLPAIHQLNRRGLEVARRLSEWRLDEARRLNRPLRQVMRDDLLVALAKRQPANRQELEALRDFNRPQLLSKGPDILARIAQARAVPADELPEHAERHEEGPGLTMLVNVLSAALAHCCVQKKVAVGLIGSTNDLKALIRWHQQERPEESRPQLATGWRDGVCGETLLDVLSGRRSLRVVDAQGEVPVDVEAVPGVFGSDCQ